MLVNCVAYHRGQKLSDISLGEVRSHLDRQDCFVWVALKDPQPEELASLQEEGGTKEAPVLPRHSLAAARHGRAVRYRCAEGDSARTASQCLSSGSNGMIASDDVVTPLSK